ncbi:hypothetical protein [Massilia sp. 9096]|uniref:hypothetical protein n=1 Tax=Massilia sp. 9096 TaxID=1500894 RepID=UPI000560FAC2|nr:hypothetical protein [Massilia sp. 9096]
MKVSEIAVILDQAKLPALTREQLHELARSDAGKGFGLALRAFAAGDVAQRDALEATVRAVDPRVRATLRGLGASAALDELVAIARVEQRRFFDAVEAIAQRSTRAAGARRYLVELGVVPALTSSPAAERAAPPYYSFHIFGSSAALCISEACTRKGNQHTVQIEGTIALGGAGGRRAFDWPNKITVQLTVQECYQLLALLENKLRSLKFDGHGREHDKSLWIEFQDSHYFVRLIQRNRTAVSVPVSAVDAIPIVSLLYKQLLANEPHLAVSHIQTMTDRLASMTEAMLTRGVRR